MSPPEPDGRASSPDPTGAWPPFHHTLRRHGRRIVRRRLSTLQVNMGLRCNQACHHCHLEAGPARSESMSRETVERIVALLAAPGAEAVRTVDVTGGAPELNPCFRTLVAACRALGKRVIDRCNLTVLLLPGQEDTAEFLADHGVEIVASLPCYTRDNVERQRGRGVFERSLEALHRLNDLGYGQPGSGLELQLVYNPLGAFLPPPQEPLEADYKRQLADEHGIVFDRLLTITNMPIKRFRRDLERGGRLDEYMELLGQSFNPETVDRLMCRELLSVGWDGSLNDCDFNQALGIPVANGCRSLWEIESLSQLDGTPVAVGDHCYGCTAGAGSSCGGALA